MAPIDPAQLLKALAPLLSVDGGINSIDQALQFSSLMKKFSKKLVSRCVYCNVLKSTKTEILTKLLNEGGWNTINIWLQDAKENENNPFLIELLSLCKTLPMTVERLKENNTPKLVKALTKFESEDIKSLSTELVTKWMTLIKGADAIAAEKAKKKKKLKREPSKDEKEQQDPLSEQKSVKDIKKNDKIVKDVEKAPAKLGRLKRTSHEKDNSKTEIYEDVKIKIDPVPKKPKIDRPKTTKVYQKKFRATGLEEETPLPRNISKKASSVDKNVAVAAVKTVAAKRLNTSLPERITEKKIKPENLLNVNETSSSNGGIKLIPAKPRPAHILHESASFMDALVAQPAPAPKRKKKVVSKPTTPPSPTIAPAKLEFYKDTLEMSHDEGKENKSETDENSDKSDEISPSSPDAKESTGDNKVHDDKSDTSCDSSAIMEERIEKEIEESRNKMEIDHEENPEITDVNALRSILTHGKRRHKKKSVRWVDDSELKQVFYFDLDENERVNVLRTHNFGDMKTLEAKREREAFEAAKRQAGDKMEESISWWIVPILIDVPPPLVEPGFQSTEKEIQKFRQQTTLQEIYFTRDMVPDTPQEPDPEIVVPQEPKIIPLDEDNSVGPIIDYTSFESSVKHPLPEVLTSLMNISANRVNPQPNPTDQVPMDNSIMLQPNPTNVPYDPGEPLGPVGLLGMAPANMTPIFNQRPMHEPENNNMAGGWRPMDMNNVAPPDAYYGNYPVNSQVIMEPMQSMSPHPNNPPLLRPRGANPFVAPEVFHSNLNKMGPQMPRPTGPPRGRIPHVPCRHFAAGSCRFGVSCSFLHPGINGPPL